MKKKRLIIWILLIVVIISIVSIFTYRLINNTNKLTSEERTWINSNINTLQNIYVSNDENLFSLNGSGVFYDFLNDFSEEYGLKINTINKTNEVNENSLSVTKTITDKDKLFYKDHYVVVSNNNEIINNNDDLSNKVVGVLNTDIDYIKSYLKNDTIKFNSFENIDELFKSVTTNYIIVPRIKYIDKILSNNLNIIYHLDDINNYYVLNVKDDVLGNILSKYFNIWEKNINKTIKKEEFKLFTKYLNIKETDIDKLLSVDYHYGFVNTSPYEVIMNGKYGGIVSEYLHEFSEFSGVYFNITKYKNNSKLVNAINKGKVDLYFSYGDVLDNNFKSTINGINNKIDVITRKDNNKMINSIYGLKNEEVYVLENSNIYKYLESIGNVNIKTYKDNNELFKLNKKDVIIVIDSYMFDYYNNLKLNNYVSKYETDINNKYTFKVNSENNTLYILLDKYMNYLDSFEVINNGLNSHNNTVLKGNILNNIAKYIILSVTGLLIVGFIVYKKSKRIRIAKRIKKDDKIRFIDDLTCLKNRAYLSDFMKTWNNNTIYPQAIIVVDLNKLQEINDKYGVLEGDKQIQACANALIKTQLDNSDLMRSDGNEFVIYTVGYNQKQIVNYIHKLNKELRKLPYNFGAEYGYSIIENDLKTIEDALNEATLDMKAKKENGKS